MFAAAASAQTTLIGAGVRNGDFEEDVDPADTRPYWATPGWYNIGTGDQNQVATRTNVVYAGARSHVVAEGAGRMGAQNTGYTISAGDLFDISYYWRDGTDWDDPGDQVLIRLFTTDTDLIGGVASTFASLVSGKSTVDGGFEFVSGQALATPTEEGKRLFIAIDTRDGNGSSNGFANVDNFMLAVTPSAKRVESIVHYGPALQNGGFESAVGSTAGNWGTGLNVVSCGTKTNTATTTVPEGLKMLSIDGSFGGLQNTGHIVQKGNTFSLAFDWTSGWQWGPTNAIAWRLLTTSDDTVGGTVSVIASGAASGKIGDGSQWDTSLVLNDGGTVNPASFGKELWVELTGVAGPNKYAKVDMVRLMVNKPPRGTMFVFE